MGVKQHEQTFWRTGGGPYRENNRPENRPPRLNWWRAFLRGLMLLLALGTFYQFGKMAEQYRERQSPAACQDTVIQLASSILNNENREVQCPDVRHRLSVENNGSLVMCTCHKSPAPTASAKPKDVPLECVTAWLNWGYAHPEIPGNHTYDEWKDKPKGCER